MSDIENADMSEVPPITPEEAASALATTDGSTGVLDSEGEQKAITALKNMEAKRKRRRRGRIIKIAIVAAVAVIALGVFLMRDTLFPPPSEEIAPEIVAVTRGDFSTTVQGSGSLKPGSTVVVTPEVSGIIESVNVVEGQHVAQGDVVVTLRNTDLDKAVSDAAEQVNAASAEVNDAQATVYDLEQSYSDAVDEYNRTVDQKAIDESNAKVAGDRAYSETYEEAIADIPEDASPEERKRLIEEAKEKAQLAYQEAYDSVPITELAVYDDATYVSAIDSAQSSVSAAVSSLNTAQKAYDQTVEEADKRLVRAPASGTVLALEAVEGAAVGGAQGGTSQTSGALMQISDMTKLKVSIEVNEIDILSIKEGQKAEITFSALPDLKLSATVKSIASVATGSGGESGMGGGGGVATFTVDLDIDQVDERLKPGMTTTVRIITEDEHDALVIPASALTEAGDTAYVQVVTSEDPLETEMREVKVGKRSSSQAVIESGLKEGEMIAYGGSMAAGGMGEDAMVEMEVEG